MSSLRKQVIVYLAVLLLAAAQLGSLTHAMDHPFHANEDSCSVYLNFEQHDLTSPGSESLAAVVIFDDADHADIDSAVLQHLSSLYFARAPPYLT